MVTTRSQSRRRKSALRRKWLSRSKRNPITVAEVLSKINKHKTSGYYPHKISRRRLLADGMKRSMVNPKMTSRGKNKGKYNLSRGDRFKWYIKPGSKRDARLKSVKRGFLYV